MLEYDSLYSTIAWGASAHHGRGPGVSYGYPHFAISFIEAAVLNSVDGSSELGILEHYKLNTNVQSLTDPAVYPEITSVIEGIEKVSVYAEWLLCEAVTALSSSQLLQTRQKDDIVHVDVITIDSTQKCIRHTTDSSMIY